MAVFETSSSGSDAAYEKSYDEKEIRTHEIPVHDAQANDFETHMPLPKHGSLHRGLKSRHITMIAIGGAIGTGLIIGTGSALARAGCVILLCFSLPSRICGRCTPRDQRPCMMQPADPASYPQTWLHLHLLHRRRPARLGCHVRPRRNGRLAPHVLGLHRLRLTLLRPRAGICTRMGAFCLLSRDLVPVPAR